MPPPDALLEPRINVGPDGKAAWRQPGGYGRTDAGYFQTFTYEGTKDEVVALAGSFDLSGATWEVTHLTGRRARLTARVGNLPGGGGTGGGEIAENVWELDPNETQKDFLEADFPYGSITAISPTEKSLIRKTLDSNLTYAQAAAEISNGNSFTAYLLMRAGVTSFPVEASVIRHTQTVSNTWAVAASYANVGRLLSNSAMVNLEGSGTLFLFSLPTIPTATQFIELSGDLQYGWRKVRPRVTRMTTTKWQIVNQYQFGLWPIRVFGAVI